MYFRVVKHYYDVGLYTKGNVMVFVRAKKLTPEEYKEITGEEIIA